MLLPGVSSKGLLVPGCSSAKTTPQLHRTPAELVSGKPALLLQITVSQAMGGLPCIRPLPQKTRRGFLTLACEGALSHSWQLSQTAH